MAGNLWSLLRAMLCTCGAYDTRAPRVCQMLQHILVRNERPSTATGLGMDVFSLGAYAMDELQKDELDAAARRMFDLTPALTSLLAVATGKPLSLIHISEPTRPY